MRTLSLKTDTIPSTVLEKRLSFRGHGGKTIVVDEPSIRSAGALGRFAAGLVSSISLRGLVSLEGFLEEREVGTLGDATGALDIDEAVFLLGSITFLGVFVDQAARVDGGDFFVVKGRDLAELAAGFGFNAAKFGKAEGSVLEEKLTEWRPPDSTYKMGME